MQLSTKKNLGLPTSRTFPAFIASVFLASFGRAAFYLGSAWLLVEEGYGASAVAYFFGVVSAAELISSPIAGWAADRWDRRRLSVGADILRATIALTIASITMPDTRPVIFTSAALLVFAERLAITASQALVPEVCRDFLLPKANSVVFLSMQYGNFLAAVLGGYLLAVYGFRPVCMTIMVAFALSAVAMLFVRPGFVGTIETSDNKLAAKVRETCLVDLMVLYGLLYGSATIISVMGASLVFDEMKGDAVDFGLMEGAWAMGSMVGAVLLIPVSRYIEASNLGATLLTLTAIALIATPLLSNPMLFVLFGLLGLLYNLGRINVEILLQTNVASHRLGRVKGWVHAAGVLAGAIVLSGVAAVGDRTIPSSTFCIFGLFVALITGTMLFIARVRT